MEVKKLSLFHISHDKGAFFGGTPGVTMAGPYLMSASTPAFKLCPYWKQPACRDAIWLPAQKKGNKPVQNNGYKQHFATDADENKITTNVIVFQSIFMGAWTIICILWQRYEKATPFAC